MDADDTLLRSIQDYRIATADQITRQIAKLYSEHQLISQGQPSIQWDKDDTIACLTEALELINAGFYERNHSCSPIHEWQSSFRRAGEILEWLSFPKFDLTSIPTAFLASAAYQIAGFPARALGLLQQVNVAETDSKILHAFFQANFAKAYHAIAEYWKAPLQRTGNIDDNLSAMVVTETIRSIGIILAELRWGDERRSEKALKKLKAIANFLVHNREPFSWMLARLCGETSEQFTGVSLRKYLVQINCNARGQQLLERYYRFRYLQNKALAWPSQIQGINRLNGNHSFVLCTPTGSGKTTVAEIAILQGLFCVQEDKELSSEAHPLVIYLVPSRALAAEVENKLSRVFANLTKEESPILVTSLYGGADWGSTESWIEQNDPTVLICTYEKAEALTRFMGPRFLSRTSMVIVDEAHTIQYDTNNGQNDIFQNRSLNLELLSARLFSLVERNQGKIIGLSAVAQGIENTLANWISGDANSIPEKNEHYSNRQLIGCLECKDGNLRIYYDLLDKNRLELDIKGKTEKQTPFVPRPFGPIPPAPRWGILNNEDDTEESIQLSFWDTPDQKQVKPKQKLSKSKILRPYLVWSALNLAKQNDGKAMSVLVSIPQYLHTYARDFLEIVDLWRDKISFSYFDKPDDERSALWNNCLACCDDYLGKKSLEYQLLERGIILHHGQLPGLLSRLFIELIEKKAVRIVLATSTLTAGVNLPFEVILIPSLCRRGKLISGREFNNLTGRAGRPGYGTEGQSLILVTEHDDRDYRAMLRIIQSDAAKYQSSQSALATLIQHISQIWFSISQTPSVDTFVDWLEKTTARDLLNSTLLSSTHSNLQQDLLMSLDALDHIVLTMLVEVESLEDTEVPPVVLEEKLKALWCRTYGFFASQNESDLSSFFLARSKAIKKIYPDKKVRCRVYATNLYPSSSFQLMELFQEIKEHAITGTDYAHWESAKRFSYIVKFTQLFGRIPKFSHTLKTPESSTQNNILHWWLDPHWGDRDENVLKKIKTSKEYPSGDKVHEWYKYVNSEFIIKLNWGIGSFISLAFFEVTQELGTMGNIDDWPQSELPWVVFWLKDLITWGTLEPVAAYLLAKGNSTLVTRPAAESHARHYYEAQPDYYSTNDLLDPRLIRDWAREFKVLQSNTKRPRQRYSTETSIDIKNSINKLLRVIPIEHGERLEWFDPAGYLIATSIKPPDWEESWLNEWDFIFDPQTASVLTEKYF